MRNDSQAVTEALARLTSAVIHQDVLPLPKRRGRPLGAYKRHRAPDLVQTPTADSLPLFQALTSVVTAIVGVAILAVLTSEAPNGPS